jgi:hypothetical protein
MGTISVHWQHRAGMFRLAVGIQAKTSAAVYVPAAGAEGVSLRGRDGEAKVYEVGSGDYVFESWLPGPGEAWFTDSGEVG